MSRHETGRVTRAHGVARGTHTCPGGCGGQVPYQHFACRTCWYRLPADLRKPITANYRRDPVNHGQAMGDAHRWYRDNPLGGAR